ncbi:hypothetical protein BJY52DRAFT_1184577 [Lactarius psammicola]|nr:hypothetical protein BJY52DRAFT_1184577 [Lactarius psammicola]
MGLLTDVFSPRNKSPPKDIPKIHIQEATPPSDPVATNSAPSASPSPPASHTPPVSQADEPEASPIAEQSDKTANSDAPPSANRRWSLQRPLELLRKSKPSPSNSEAHNARARAASKAAGVNAKRVSLSHSDRRAKESALVLRSLIVGQNSGDSSAAPQVRVSRAQLDRVKAQLLKPKTANKVIAQLRALPALPDSASQTSPPICAVCLPYTDEEADEKHFSQLRDVEHTKDPAFRLPTIASATIASITEALNGLHIVSLFTAPDLGLGQPGDGEGLLAGAVPTAETVINGIVQITPQLMALGYAAGKNIIPDHAGIYPPVDRISVLTYWWGLELLLPPPTLVYLGVSSHTPSHHPRFNDDFEQRVHSITSTVINFLAAMSVMYEGVREILPFVRYFSQYIDFEWNSIKSQNHGKGVICAATWIMPAAMVARPWDFPDPPKNVEPPTQSTPSDAKTPATAPASTPTASDEKAAPTPPSSPPKAAPGSPPSPEPAAHDSLPGIVILAPDSA